MDISFLIPVAQAAEEAHSGGVAGTLGINVTYFIAQLVNFGVILFIMWKWVFPPITKALLARTERIEKSLKDADRVAKEKQEFAVWREEQIVLARTEAAEILKTTKEKAENLEAIILAKTRNEQQVLIEKGKAALLEEKEKAILAAKQELAGLVVQATRVVLKEKLDAEKDQGLIKQALREVM